MSDQQNLRRCLRPCRAQGHNCNGSAIIGDQEIKPREALLGQRELRPGLEPTGTSNACAPALVQTGPSNACALTPVQTGTSNDHALHRYRLVSVMLVHLHWYRLVPVPSGQYTSTDWSQYPLCIAPVQTGPSPSTSCTYTSTDWFQ